MRRPNVFVSAMFAYSIDCWNANDFQTDVAIVFLIVP